MDSDTHTTGKGPVATSALAMPARLRLINTMIPPATTGGSTEWTSRAPNAFTAQMPLSNYKIVVPVKVLGTLDKWSPATWRADAFCSL